MIRKSLLCGAGAAFLLAGCGRMDRETEFRAALPSKELVETKAPAKAGQGLEADVHAQGGQGQTSDMYQLTRGASLFVNGGTVRVLSLVDAVTKHRPTSVTEDSAVWGPHSDALDPNAWKLTVTKTGEGMYSYTLEAKGKNEADSAFKTLLSGKHTARMDVGGEPVEGFGSGEFTLDWDAAQTLPKHDDNVGKMTVRYSRLDETSGATVDADFRQVKDRETGQRVDADYRYKSTPSAGGEFQFGLTKDWYQPGNTASAAERLTIKSRWQQSGTGRSDIRVSGGDLAHEATANECWDSNFASQFLKISFEANPRYGTEAGNCAIVGAEYSTLSLLGRVSR